MALRLLLEKKLQKTSLVELQLLVNEFLEHFARQADIQICYFHLEYDQNILDYFHNCIQLFFLITRDYGGFKLSSNDPDPDSSGLRHMRIYFHYMRHILEDIVRIGPPWAFWQFPMERLCGMMVPKIHSHQHPIANLTNNVHLMTLFQQMQYVNPKLHSKIHQQRIKRKKQKSISIDSHEAELYSLGKKKRATPLLIRLLQVFYKTLYYDDPSINVDMESMNDPNFSEYTQWGRLLTKDGHLISSSAAGSRAYYHRCNETIAVCIYLPVFQHNS